jgi:hypothetical protein
VRFDSLLNLVKPETKFHARWATLFSAPSWECANLFLIRQSDQVRPTAGHNLKGVKCVLLQGQDANP